MLRSVSDLPVVDNFSSSRGRAENSDFPSERCSTPDNMGMRAAQQRHHRRAREADESYNAEAFQLRFLSFCGSTTKPASMCREIVDGVHKYGTQIDVQTGKLFFRGAAIQKDHLHRMFEFLQWVRQQPECEEKLKETAHDVLHTDNWITNTGRNSGVCSLTDIVEHAEQYGHDRAEGQQAVCPPGVEALPVTVIVQVGEGEKPHLYVPEKNLTYPHHEVQPLKNKNEYRLSKINLKKNGGRQTLDIFLTANGKRKT